jgi:hypothetical protein
MGSCPAGRGQPRTTGFVGAPTGEVHLVDGGTRSGDGGGARPVAVRYLVVVSSP